MELAGVDDEFGGDVEGLEGLVHLFAADDGDVEIVGPAHVEGGRVHALVGLEERVAELEVEVAGFPGDAELVVVLEDVLVGSVEGEGRG